jgi:hypothetical protein
MKVIDPPSRDDRPLWDVWLATFNFPVLTVADEIGLFTLLAKQALSPTEIAEQLKIGARATEGILGVLTSLGFVLQHDGQFLLTELSRNYLLPESPYYWGGLLRNIHDSLPTHESIRDAALKDYYHDAESPWDSGEIPQARAERLTRHMHAHSMPAAMGVARWGNFTGVKRLLDVAGGSGCFPIALAMRYPHMRFTVLELAPVVALAKQYIADYGMQDRIDTLVANMFRDPFPSGYDAVFFSNIYHDWKREECLRLTRSSFDALPSGGHIYIHEMLLDDTKDRPISTMGYAIQMLVGTQGKQYSAAEIRAMLTECGFDSITVTPTFSYFTLIRATKP